MTHPYRVTVRSLAAELHATSGASLTFDVSNHDEILGLVDRVRGLGVLPESEIVEFTIGLKLFSEVMLRHRREHLFAELFPHFGTFMKRLKAGAGDEGPAR